MKNYKYILLLLSAAFLFSSCSMSKTSKKILPRAVSEQMVDIVDALARRDKDYILTHALPEFRAIKNIDKKLDETLAYVIDGKALETRLLTANIEF